MRGLGWRSEAPTLDAGEPIQEMSVEAAVDEVMQLQYGPGPMSEEPHEFAEAWIRAIDAAERHRLTDASRTIGLALIEAPENRSNFGSLEILLEAYAEAMPQEALAVLGPLLRFRWGREAALCALDTVVRLHPAMVPPVQETLQAHVDRLGNLSEYEEANLCEALSYLPRPWVNEFRARLGLDCDGEGDAAVPDDRTDP